MGPPIASPNKGRTKESSLRFLLSFFLPHDGIVPSWSLIGSQYLNTLKLTAPSWKSLEDDISFWGQRPIFRDHVNHVEFQGETLGSNTNIKWWLGCTITSSARYLGSITILRKWVPRKSISPTNLKNTGPHGQFQQSLSTHLLKGLDFLVRWLGKRSKRIPPNLLDIDPSKVTIPKARGSSSNHHFSRAILVELPGI